MKLRLCAVAIGVAALAVFALAGCGGSKEEPKSSGSAAADAVAEAAVEHAAAEQGQNVDVDINSASETVTMSVKSEDGTTQMSMGGSIEAPKDLPEDVTVYPGLTLQVAQVIPETHECMLTGETADAVEKVVEYYKTELAGKGWTVAETSTMALPTGPMSSVQLKKGERSISVTAMVAEGKTRVTLSAT